MFTRLQAFLLPAFCLVAAFGMTDLTWGQLELTERYAATPLANDIAVGDFNGDGYDDFAVGSYLGTLQISLHLSNGDGTFQPPLLLTVGTQPCCLVADDFNHDGKVDLAVLAVLDDTVDVLLGNGDGTFQQSINSPIPRGSTFIRSGDLNGDGKPDVVVSSSYISWCVSVLLGNGDGTFQSPVCNSSLTTNPHSHVIADFNHDGKLDVAIVGSDPALNILFGNGDGTLESAVAYPLPGLNSPNWVTAADLNGDGNADLAIVDFTSSVGEAFLGNPDGTFQTGQFFRAASARSIAAADFNRDGKLDLVVADFTEPGEAGVLLGNGDGTFAAPQYWKTDPLFSGVAAVGDFNGDGLPDVANTSYTGGRVAVLIGTGAMKFLPGTPLDFRTTGTQSVSRIVHLENTGTASITIQSIRASAGFTFVSNCGHSLAPGSTCRVKITFHSQGVSRRGRVLILDSVSSKPQPVILRGIVR